MGLFDIFKRAKQDDDTDEPKIDRSVARLGRLASDKRAQSYDRLDAIQSLCEIGTEDSAAALLKRLSFYIEPSITNQEEKDIAFQGIVAAGQAAVDPIREFCVKAESFTWPMKMLKELLDEDAFVDELLILLERFDTDYSKNQEPKLQLIAELDGKKRDDVRVAVERFLDDFDERVRFHTVGTLFSQDHESSAILMCQALVGEESVRVKNRIADGMASHKWQVPEALRSQVVGALPGGYVLRDGVIKQN
ncbi:MAG: HEAT repeat domain-containing protein [Polyangiaceae bacterium]|nr:HEAT repeat domain-containing protein [Polyangiaceae bacterium]